MMRNGGRHTSARSGSEELVRRDEDSNRKDSNTKPTAVLHS